MAHISLIEDKTATNLATAEMPDDGYHNAIRNAAKVLVEEESGDEFVYFGATSATLWAHISDPNVVVRSIAFGAWNKWLRQQEVVSEYAHPAAALEPIRDELLALRDEIDECISLVDCDLPPIEILKIRTQRYYEKLTPEMIENLTPMEYARLTGDTSRLSEQERERFSEQQLEERSGYR